MRVSAILGATALLGLLPNYAVGAENAPSAGFSVPKRDSKATPIDLLEVFDSKDQSYILGEGDEIALTVWNRPELSGKHIVGPDGKITLPYGGVVKIGDLTREEAVDVISKLLGSLYEDLNITLQVTRYESNRIFVLGRVANPGVLRYEGQLTLLEAVTRAGGLPIGGIGAEKAALCRCMVFRGKDQVVWIDLRSLLNGSNLALNIHFKRNDTLYIPDSDDQLIYVMGEVRKPGAIRMTPDMTFLNALAQAGGVTDEARSGKIRLVRPSANIDREFDLKDFYRAAKAQNVSLQDGDVIYVPRSVVGSAGYVFQKLSPITGWMLFGTTFLK
jgi:polysaccharide biosynthesis/export protein